MKKLFILIFLAFKALAFENFLPDAVAFKSSLEFNEPHQAQLIFDIADGYDIYSDKISVTALDNSSTKIGKIIYPPPISMKNDIVGDYSVYQHLIYIPIPITNLGNGELNLQVKFQGCKGLSYCYPGMIRKLTAKYKHISINTNNILKNQKAINKSSAGEPKISNTKVIKQPSEFLSNFFSNNTNNLKNDLQNRPIITIIGFLILGLLIAFTPCVFPMFPILLSIVAGKRDKDAFLLSLAYIIGGSCIYALAGIIFSYIGISLQNYFQNIWMAIFMAIILLILSLSLFGLFDIKLPSILTNKLSNLTNKSSGSYITTFLIGAVSTLILSPCVTAPLAGALLYISTTHNVVLGGIALFIFGIGIGLPLVFISLLGNHYLPRSGSWMLKVKEFLGLLMLLLAIYAVHAFVNNSVIYALAGLWVIVLAILIYKSFNNKAFRLFIGLIMFGLGGIIIVYPHLQNQAIQSQSNPFTATVTNLSDLKAILNNNNQITILDFSASWCIACHEMDATTWSDSNLLELMKKTKNIRVDISNNDRYSKELEAQYNVFAPPSVIIIDKHGNIIKSFMGNTKAIDIIKFLEK